MTGEKPKEVPEQGWLAGLVPTGLVPERQTQGFADLRKSHKSVVTAALHWQQQASRADSFEIQATIKGVEEGRGYSLMHQMGAVGEQLALAYAAKVEVVNWHAAASDPKFMPSPPADDSTRVGLIEACSRALSEVQADYLLAAGHGLSNMCLYALCFSDPLRLTLAERLGHPDPTNAYRPFSNSRHDWLSLNTDTLREMRRSVRETSALSPEGHRTLLGFVESASELARSESWRTVSTLRADFFHRWRPMSAGLPGGSKATPWKRDVPGSRSLGVGARPMASKEAQEFAERLESSAGELLSVTAERMDRCLSAWPEAFAALTM